MSASFIVIGAFAAAMVMAEDIKTTADQILEMIYERAAWIESPENEFRPTGQTDARRSARGDRSREREKKKRETIWSLVLLTAKTKKKEVEIKIEGRESV